jgi:hypothetical protein
MTRSDVHAKNMERERKGLLPHVRRRYVNDLWSIRQIAVELGQSYGRIHAILREAEIPFRSRGGGDHLAKINKEERRALLPKVRAMYLIRKLSVREIAEEVNCSTWAIHRVLKEGNVPMRPAGRVRRD